MRCQLVVSIVGPVLVLLPTRLRTPVLEILSDHPPLPPSLPDAMVALALLGRDDTLTANRET